MPSMEITFEYAMRKYIDAWQYTYLCYCPDTLRRVILPKKWAYEEFDIFFIPAGNRKRHTCTGIHSARNLSAYCQFPNGSVFLKGG